MIFDLAALGDIVTGFTPSTKVEDYYSDRGYPFITPAEIKGTRFCKPTGRHVSEKTYKEFSKRFVSKHSVLVDCIGSDMGNACLTQNACLTNQQINAITNIKSSRVLPMFLYYKLSTMKAYFHSIGMNGSTMPIISKSLFGQIQIEVPALFFQQHIVDILGTLDSKIEDNDKENMHLENLFYQLWVKHFQNKSFEKLPLGSVLNIKYGRNLPTTQLQNTGYVVYGGNGTIGFFSSYMYEKPKVLVSCRGAASGNVIYSQPYSFITNNSLILEDNLNITYPYLRGLVKDLHFEKYTTGSAQPQITIDNISSIEIPVPPIELQSNFEIVTQPILDKLENLRTNNEKLNELKTLYLIKFFG